jgi:hypothetical protein
VRTRGIHMATTILQFVPIGLATLLLILAEGLFAASVGILRRCGCDTRDLPDRDHGPRGSPSKEMHEGMTGKRPPRNSTRVVERQEEGS